MPFDNMQGLFSSNLDAVTNQAFFDAAFAGRIHTDKIYKEAYNCNILQECTLSSWLDEYTGYSTDCNPAYSLIETNRYQHQIEVAGNVTIGANPATGVIDIANNSHFVNGAYVLPQVGNTIVSPAGLLMEVTAVTHATNNDTTITVRIRNTGVTAVLTAGDRLLVLSGSFIADCACPDGNFAFPDLPIVHDLNMITIGDKGDLCGDALLKCQYLMIPFTDECGNVYEKWYTGALQEMYRRFETRKHAERLLNPLWGLLPTLKTRGINFATDSTTEITMADVNAFKAQIVAAGNNCREFAIFAGTTQYSQWQSFLQATGVTQLNYTPFAPGECKWINMEYCGIKIGGLTLHIYEDCSFSSPFVLGGAGSAFPNASIWIPMCDRQTNCRGGGDSKMLTTVYFRDNAGRVWDNLTDSNGVLNGPGGRNTFGVGCNQHEWSIQTRMLQEIHCANMWGYSRLP